MIGKRVRKLRRDQKLTLDMVAAKIGTKKAGLSLMERGFRDFGSERIKILVRELGLKVSDIYGEPKEGQ